MTNKSVLPPGSNLSIESHRGNTDLLVAAGGSLTGTAQ